MADFVESTSEDGRGVLKLVGEVDITVADEFIAAGQHCLDNCTAVELDLGELSFIDSSGLGALVRIRNAATEQAKPLVLTNVSEQTHRLLRITGLDRTFDVQLKHP